LKSIQILFKQKGVLVEKWIVGGSSNLGSKVLTRTKEFTKNKLICNEHEDLANIEAIDKGIFCKTCGLKLKIVPEWVVAF